MIGSVVDGRATLQVTVRGPSGQEGVIEGILDTGFEGFVSLPRALVSSLSLPFLSYFQGLLADGRIVRFEVFAGTLDWEGCELEVEVLAAGREPLLGTALLDGHAVEIEFVSGGLVSVERL